MSAQDNGGSAFPEVPGDFNAYEGRAGMTLRDYFAAKVMAALAADASRSPDTVYMNYEAAARESYKLADAMLAARVQPAEAPP